MTILTSAANHNRRFMDDHKIIITFSLKYTRRISLRHIFGFSVTARSFKFLTNLEFPMTKIKVIVDEVADEVTMISLKICFELFDRRPN